MLGLAFWPLEGITLLAKRLIRVTSASVNINALFILIVPTLAYCNSLVDFLSNDDQQLENYIQQKYYCTSFLLTEWLGHK